MLHGHTAWSAKTARSIERFTKGVIKAEDLAGKISSQTYLQEKLNERI